MDAESPGSRRSTDGRSSSQDLDQTLQRSGRRVVRTRSKAAVIGRVVGLGLCAALCVGSAIAGTFVGNIYYHSKAGGIMIGNVFHNIKNGKFNASFPIADNLPADKQATINLLLLGCDVDYEPGRPVVLKNSRGRSDSIMVAKMDFVNNRVSVLSIPRDTAVRIPGHRINKINAANALEGPELTQQTIKETFGIDTDYYVSINFDTFRKIVDKVGGVDLTVEKRLKYDDNWGHLHVNLYPGFQHLDGYQAMGYVRIRHSDDDLHRAARQHAFLEAIRAKVASPSTWGKVPDLLNTVTEDVHSNLQLAQLLAIVQWVKSVPKENVQMDTMPSFEGRSYVTVNVPKAEDVVKRLFFNNLTTMPINAPDMSVVDEITGHGKHKHTGKTTKASAVTVKGSDEPLMSIEDEPLTDTNAGSGAAVNGPAGTGDNTTKPGTKKSDPDSKGGGTTSDPPQATSSPDKPSVNPPGPPN